MGQTSSVAQNVDESDSVVRLAGPHGPAGDGAPHHVATTRPVWFTITVHQPDFGFAAFWVGLLGAGLLLFSRGPSRLLHPELWAEDGVLWLAQAYDVGRSCLLIPVVGYLQTLSRLGAMLAVHLPLTWAPLIFALIAFVVQLAPVAILLSRRAAALVPYWPARLLLSLYYVGLPNSHEVYVNLTNAMWHLALVAFLLVILPKPRTTFGVAADGAVLVLAGLSGPLVLFIAPVAWWQVVAARHQPDGPKRVLYAGLLSLCALVQGGLVAAHLGTARAGNLGADPDRLAHILADQIFLGGIIGGNNVSLLLQQPFWLRFWPAVACCVAGFFLMGAAFLRGPRAFRQLTVLAALIMASALKSPMITFSQPEWFPMQYPGIGGRYYVIPMLAWFAALTVLAASSRTGLRWVARALIACCMIGVASDWVYPPYVATAYHNAAKTFARAPAGTTVSFPENPIGWTFALTKR